MDAIERIAFIDNSVGLYKRYVDDIFALFKNKDDALQFYNKMNNTHKHIQFEIELPTEENALSLLDFTIKINKSGECQYKFYKKSALKDIFVHYESALPNTLKENVIMNEYNRISDRCTTDEDRNIALRQFDEKLTLNKYPKSFIKQCRNKNLIKPNRGQKQINEREYYYLKFPYISESINHKIRRIFLNEGINIRLYDHKYTLRKRLNNNKDHTEICKKKNCPINNNKLCFIQQCVYQLRCLKCGETYIGSTIRSLHTRIAEHYSHNASSAYKHKQQCQSRYEVIILDRESDPVNLRLKEGLYIKQLQPKINSKEDICEIATLIF